MDTRFKPTYHVHRFTRRTRTRSTIDLTDISMNQTNQLTQEKVLGSGNYARVRLFRKNEYTASVKAPHIYRAECKSVKDAIIAEQDAKEEFELYRMANPHLFPYALYFIPRDPDKGKHVDFRMVLPYIKGKPLNEFLNSKANINTQQLAHLILRIAQELNRIHQKDIVHGDVACRNILVERAHNDFIVQFIDYGIGCRVGKKAQTGFVIVNRATSELAPEREPDNPKLLGHANQDIYSLGKTLQLSLDLLSAKDKAHFYSDYLPILGFITKALSDPEDRPTLPDFILELQEAILINSITSKYHPLIKSLCTKNFDQAKQWLAANNQSLDASSMQFIFYCLAKERLLDAASFLLSQQRFLAIDRKVDQQTIFHLIVGWGDDYSNFLMQLFDYLTPDKRKVLLDTKDDSNQTILQIAAKNNQMGLCIAILRHDQQIYSNSKYLECVVAVAGPVVKPLFNLIEYYCSFSMKLRSGAVMFSSSSKGEANATKFLINHVLQNYPNISALNDKSHQLVIEGSRKLSQFYNSFIKAGLLKSEEKPGVEITESTIVSPR